MAGRQQVEGSTQLRCYELAAPGLLASHADVVATAVRRAVGVPRNERYVVAVSAHSGWISYQDSELLWHGRAPLPPRATALSRAQDVLRRLQRTLSDDTVLPESLRGLLLVPDRLRPVELVALPGPSTGVHDHWLFRADSVLPLGRGLPDARVVGAEVEVRVGAAGIVGLSSRWRALTRRTTVVPQQPPARRLLGHAHGEPAAGAHAGNGAGHDHAHGEAAGHPPTDELVYVLDGEGVPQPRLTPFYRRAGGHGASFASACALSLTVDLLGENVGDGMRLSALAAGGSGGYDYDWAIAPLADPFDLELLPGSTTRFDEDGVSRTAGHVVVPIGAHLVVVQVHDRATGAFQHFQQHVFCSPFRFDGTPAVEPSPDAAPGVA